MTGATQVVQNPAYRGSAFFSFMLIHYLYIEIIHYQFSIINYTNGNSRRQESDFLDGGREQDHPAEPEASAQKHLTLVLLWGEDWHHRSEWCR